MGGGRTGGTEGVRGTGTSWTRESRISAGVRVQESAGRTQDAGKDMAVELML